MTTTKHVLASSNFFQDWTDTGQITTDDNWNGVASIVGYRGDNVVASAGTNPQLATGDGTVTIDVNANRVDQGTFGTGGVAEFELANPVVAMQGSGTADAPHLVIYLDATGRENIVFSFKARDIDSTADNAIQQVAVQYRVGGSGAWTDLPAGYISDATTGPSLATLETTRTVTLPAGANNASDLQIRIITADAVGTDEWVGIDDILVTSSAIGGETQTVQFDPTSVTHAEGDTGTTTYTFTVTRTGGITGQLDFSGTFNSGSTDNADYVGGTAPTVFSGSILAGQTSATVTINVQGDYAIEPSEAFTLTLTAVNNTDGSVTEVIGTNLTATGNITNDDSPGTISVDDVSLAEGDAGPTAGSFTVNRTGGATGTVSVDYLITLPGSPNAAGSDVSGPLSGTVTFLEGETTASIPFTVNGDITNEPNETFTVTLSNAMGGATIGDGTATATITNDDAPPVISIGDASLVEGDDGVTYLVFTVSLSKPSIDPVTVDFETADGSAAEDSDYLGLTGQVSFAPGDTSETISVPLIGDENPENNETLTVTLSNPSGGTIGDGSATGTITNDDGAAYYSLAGGPFSQDWTNTGLITANDDWSGVPYIVGYLGDIDSGTTAGVDPRTLTGAALGAIDVIANQSAATSSSGGVGEFELSNPTIGLQGSGTADAPSIVLYMDATGRSNILVQALLRDIDGTTDNTVQSINVQYRTDPGGSWTNVPAGYFTDVTTGPSLATEETPLNVLLPSGANGAATLEIRIMTTNAASFDEWVGIDNIVVSSDPGTPSLSIANTAVYEGDSGPTEISFTVTRAGPSTGAVSADWTVSFGGGVFDANSADFVAGQLFTGTVAFGDGETSATITLDVEGDIVAEGDEDFTVTLSNPSVGAVIGDGTATGTIVNDDGPPSLVTIDDVSVVEGDSGSVNLVFTVTRTGGSQAFDVDFFTTDITASSAVGPGQDYLSSSGTVNFAADEMSRTISIAIYGDTDPELSETFRVTLQNATNGALITDPIGIGTIETDDPLFIHQIQGTSYFSPVLAAEGISGFNIASTGTVRVQAIVTAVDDSGTRQGYYIQEEITDWDGNSFTSEGIFVMTQNDDGVGDPVSGVAVGDLVTVTGRVMEYQHAFANPNMPITILDQTELPIVHSSGNLRPTLLLDGSHAIPSAVMTLVTPDYTDSSDDLGDSFDASLYGLSYWETVEGMHVTIPGMVVADGFVDTGGDFFQAYSTVHADADQLNSRGGYTIAGDPPVGPPDTGDTTDDTIAGGRHLHDGDVNSDTIEIDFTGFAIDAPPGLMDSLSMGDELGDVTGIIDFQFENRNLFVTDYDPGDFVNHQPAQETTAFGNDGRSLTVATFNVENLGGNAAQSRFDDIADAIANNLNAPDIISIEEIQDNNGATNDGTTDASTTWNRLVTALNLATGANYQWVDQEPGNTTEGGQTGGNIRVGFLYNTDRVQLGDLAANATIAERRQYTDRIGDGVRDGSDLIAFSDDMIAAEINAADWSGTRRSLLGEFTFNGNTVYVVANHWPAKIGSGEYWQFDQDLANGDPENGDWAQRSAVAEDVYEMLNVIASGAPDAGIASGGDYNEFYFYRPMTTVTGYTMADGTTRVGGARFDNLTLTLSEAERYTYTFDGRSQAIDHIVVNDLLSGVASYDVVHINTGYNASGTGPDVDPSLSDHDPALSSFDYREFSELLIGTAGIDMILGFGGNDVIDGRAGDDVVGGNLGNDTFIVDAAGDQVNEAVGEGIDAIYSHVSYTLGASSEVETLSTITWQATNAIDLTGNGISNYLIGNDGVNVLNGGGGADAMVGRAGNDVYIVDHAGDQVVEGVGGGIDAIYSAVSYSLNDANEVETLSTLDWTATTPIDLTGNALANYMIGNAGANVLDGKGGADFTQGREGNDVYIVDNALDIVFENAAEGSDAVYTKVSYALNDAYEVETLSTFDWAATTAINLTGNAGANYLIGNAGANVLDGKGGNDFLVSQGGADVFAFTSALGAGNVDTIFGFEGGDGDDVIRLDHHIFLGLANGTLDDSAFHNGTAAGDADDRIIYDGATGNLYFDSDGTGAAAQILFAVLDGSPLPLTAGDFIIV